MALPPMVKRPMAQLKLILIIVSLLGAGGMTWRIYHQGEVDAEQKAENEGLRLGMQQYDTALKREIKARDSYSQAAAVLSQQYIKAEQEAADAKRQLHNLDLDDIDSINAGIERMLADIEKDSCRLSAASAKAAAAPDPCPDDSASIHARKNK